MTAPSRPHPTRIEQMHCEFQTENGTYCGKWAVVLLKQTITGKSLPLCSRHASHNRLDIAHELGWVTVVDG